MAKMQCLVLCKLLRFKESVTRKLNMNDRNDKNDADQSRL